MTVCSEHRLDVENLITRGESIPNNSRKGNSESIALTQLSLQFSLYCFFLIVHYHVLSFVHIHAWFLLIFTSPHIILTIVFSKFSPYKLLFVLSYYKPFQNCFFKTFPLLCTFRNIRWMQALACLSFSSNIFKVLTPQG